MNCTKKNKNNVVHRRKCNYYIATVMLKIAKELAMATQVINKNKNQAMMTKICTKKKQTVRNVLK